MYDAIDDPYTYENSTVLINRLDLRNQGELDDFEAEISNARAGEPLPEGHVDFAHYCAIHHHLFQDVMNGRVSRDPSEYPSRAIRFVFPSISRPRRRSFFLI
jgi:cell filamentation protein